MKGAQFGGRRVIGAQRPAPRAAAIAQGRGGAGEDHIIVVVKRARIAIEAACSGRARIGDGAVHGMALVAQPAVDAQAVGDFQLFHAVEGQIVARIAGIHQKAGAAGEAVAGDGAAIGKGHVQPPGMGFCRQQQIVADVPAVARAIGGGIDAEGRLAGPGGPFQRGIVDQRIDPLGDGPDPGLDHA
jgi:hypothetical protein